MRRHLGLLLALALVGALSSQQSILQPNKDPHKNPGCGLRGSASRVPCKCPHMVQHTHEVLARKCWRKQFGFAPPAGIEGLEYLATAETLKCLAKIPDDCEIVSYGSQNWGVDSEKQYLCQTRCRPERCGCRDRACKSHAEGA